MDKLKNYVKTVIKDYLKKELPHTTLPGAMVAVVTKAEDHYYTLKILGRNLQEDKNFPEIPSVASNVECKKGELVVVVFLYGIIAPYIVGRYAK